MTNSLPGIPTAENSVPNKTQVASTGTNPDKRTPSPNVQVQSPTTNKKKKFPKLIFPFIAVLILFLVCLVLPLTFYWWWNPKTIPLSYSKDELENIELPELPNLKPDSPVYSMLTNLNPDLNWKVPMDLKACTRGDRRKASNGMGHDEVQVLMNIGDTCILKYYTSFEGSYSVRLCSVPKSENKMYIFSQSVLENDNNGYCKRLPKLFLKYY